MKQHTQAYCMGFPNKIKLITNHVTLKIMYLKYMHISIIEMFTVFCKNYFKDNSNSHLAEGMLYVVLYYLIQYEVSHHRINLPHNSPTYHNPISLSTQPPLLCYVIYGCFFPFKGGAIYIRRRLHSAAWQ